mmetsp:Transcript_17348/g.28059  ORF Transcript_17348/g.28059 Transcript_17348/m.28059 type:complete len:114 (-) Transcript_17348:748-1089(-)
MLQKFANWKEPSLICNGLFVPHQIAKRLVKDLVQDWHHVMWLYSAFQSSAVLPSNHCCVWDTKANFPQVISVVDVSDESWVEPTLMAINDENWDGAASDLWKWVDVIEVGPPG